MNKAHLNPLLLSIAILAGCGGDKQEDERDTFSDYDRFEGLWTLHIMERRDSASGEWSEWRDGMQGYILYDGNDNMAVHLIVRGYQNTDLRFLNFIDTLAIEKLKHLTGSYVYFAKYAVDENEKTVQHARISHSNPNDWNEVVKRWYDFRGDTLILSPMEQQNSSLRLKWLKEAMH